MPLLQGNEVPWREFVVSEYDYFQQVVQSRKRAAHRSSVAST